VRCVPSAPLVVSPQPVSVARAEELELFGAGHSLQVSMRTAAADDGAARR
jgi:hypothetical protein